MAGKVIHRYTVEEMGALIRAFDSQLLTAAALIFSTQEGFEDEEEKRDAIDLIVLDVLYMRDSIVAELMEEQK